MPSAFRRLRTQVVSSNRRQRLVRAAVRSLRPGFGEPVEVRVDPDMPHAHDAIIRRKGQGFEVLLSGHNPALTQGNGPSRLPAYLHWFKHCGPEVEAITVTLSDGDRSSAGRFSPSTFLPGVTAIPDPSCFSSNAYAWERSIGLQQGMPWRERSDTLVWRGGMNSGQSFDLDVARVQPALAAQRLLACLALSSVAGTDVRFVHAGQPETGREVYEQAGISGQVIASRSWLTMKYALDIDGHTNAWSNLFSRLLFGCCVLKVESRYGYRQWYYDRLRPWEHYVPVAADLSDIGEKLDWVRSNEAQSHEIAQRGRQLVLPMTLGAVTREAAGLIAANWQRTGELDAGKARLL